MDRGASQAGMPGKFPGRGKILRNRWRLIVWIAVFCLGDKSFCAIPCPVTQPHQLTEAEKALLAADYAKAVSFFQAELAAHPANVEAAIGLVHALLRQQKVQEAADAVKAALALAPKSPALITLRGEVEYRQGMPWIAAQTAFEASDLDPCVARTHLLLANIERISSFYASSSIQIENAHQLDPTDPDIRGEWIRTLSLKQRIAETEAYLSAPTGKDEDDLRRWKQYLESLKKLAGEPHKACQLVSKTTATDIPFEPIMQDAVHIRAYGLDVKLNDRKATLQIDTGASGLTVTRSVAKHAGLTPFSEIEVGGIGDHKGSIGDKGFQPGYSAYADSIHIGNLEFHDCQVRVLDSKSNLDVDGLVGMDTLSHFLVTLDYPAHKLLLAPLPPRPGEIAETPALKTSDVVRDEDSVALTPLQKQAAHGLYNRYIAPEMKDYLPIYRNGHQLILPAGLNSKETRLFILDTGAFATSISPEAGREVTKLRSNYAVQVKGISGDVTKVYSADDVTFYFAKLSQHVNNVVSFDTSHISKNTGMEISGFLGATTLNLLTIHIDYRDGLIKFDYDPKRIHTF
jgi:tetratricopeptide (TPR) repeat protein